ncbi:MAG: DNA methylase [Muribaculaceae bacterium]|nr:DNA methylase [Muribaculaceae bacterium]
MERETEHIYIAIDLKSFYASVECVDQGMDPLTTNLVVADISRTEKTICLAVSPALKACGIPGRPRLFEVVQRVGEINQTRLLQAPGHRFSGSSCDAEELRADRGLQLAYVTAPPRMARYMECSAAIYDVYLKYISKEDIHVYSIDEVFMDVTHYLAVYRMTARELAAKIIRDVLDTTGITATAGIGTNLYLAKIAMDIVAKHIDADETGVRIAELNERSYREMLWDYRPITDFWRVGAGYAKKLAEHGLYTMGDVARCSVGGAMDFHNEELLYRLFGVNAELLIDHAWGYEPCTIAEVKAYQPESSSVGSGQVLQCPYPFEKARLIVQEMTDQLVLELVDKGLVTDQLVLTVGYDRENLSDETRAKAYRGEVTLDRYGRRVPKHAHGTARLKHKIASTRLIMEAVLALYDRIVDTKLLVRRVTLAACEVVEQAKAETDYEQLSLFSSEEEGQKKHEEEVLEKERRLQQAVLGIQKRYGKNSILKGMNLEEGAMAKERNRQIGGHKA